MTDTRPTLRTASRPSGSTRSFRPSIAAHRASSRRGSPPSTAVAFSLAAALALPAAFALPGLASAQTAGNPADGTPRTLSVSGTVTGSAALVTDYRFRGVSQTFGDPALQAGVDFALPSNFYLGAWTSMVDKEIYADTRGFELDLYGGYRHALGRGLLLDVGLLQYLYPSKSRFSTLEAYAGITWEWLTFKYSHSLTNRYFGVQDARGSQYYDLKAVYPIGNGFNLVGHYGVTRISNNPGNYTDYSVGVNRDWRGFTWSATLVDTDSTFSFTNRAGRTRDLGDRALVLGVAKAF